MTAPSDTAILTEHQRREFDKLGGVVVRLTERDNGDLEILVRSTWPLRRFVVYVVPAGQWERG